MKKNLKPSAGLPCCSILAVMLVTGCSTPNPPPPERIPLVQEFSGKGYLSEEKYSLTTTPISWARGETRYDFLLSVPARPGRYPLVIYLPGIGESRSAGEAWRSTWAQAGYAVLSIQLLEEDGRLWESREARSGDFRPLVRARYDGFLIRQRQEILRGLLTELQQRQGSDPLLAGLDLGKIVLAGYDLGAHTALVAAGERLDGRKEGKPDPAALTPSAVVLLSPWANFSGRAFEERYADLKIPILSVTGHGDTDPFGLVPTDALRAAPFQYMPPGGKYLLMLEDTSHALIAGGNLQTEVPQGRNVSGETSEVGDGRGGDPGGSGRRKRAGPSGSGGNPGGHLDNGMGWGMNQSVIKAVSTAFLDQQVKGDSFAAEWLRRDARRWLRNTAELTVR